MRLYRVAGWDARAGAGTSGHPLFVDRSRQGGGRADNPAQYAALYLSETPQGAVGEVFGDLDTWTDGMFATPWLPGGCRALVTVDTTRDLHTLDLDDGHVLAELNARPTDVVGRDRERSRELALQVWSTGEWDGLRWWSWWRPVWRNQVLWSTDSTAWPLEVTDVTPLELDHPAVETAASMLPRPRS